MPHIYTISNILYVRVTSLHAFNEYGDDNDENDDDDADNIILPISVCVCVGNRKTLMRMTIKSKRREMNTRQCIH